MSKDERAELIEQRKMLALYNDTLTRWKRTNRAMGRY